jgi:membrane protein CcdC involved in cytochrome C biogenesis
MHASWIVPSLLGAAVIFVWRKRETQRPVTERAIVIPPLGMATGFSMFVILPATRIPWTWALCAFAIGALVLSYPLIRTSRLHREGDVVMLQRSKAFLWVFVGLFAIRFAARAYVEDYVSTLQTGALFFVLAFGMIVRWRIAMYREYKQLVAQRG